jgi:solute carrier family 35 (UDP-sugar transporter), member A1/2/3
MIKENKDSGIIMFDNTSSFFNIKTIVLVSLCLQNAGYTLLRKYTTKFEHVSSKEILLVSEVMKLLFSIYMIIYDIDGGKSDAPGSGLNKLIWLIQHSHKMLILALIYAIMNILSFIALEYIGAGEFTICAQLKILTTASFSVIVLGTSLSFSKWRALALLVLGCILVASPSFNNNNNNLTTNNKSIGDGSGSSGEWFVTTGLGFGAVLTEVVLSGFASIYFEKVVKSTVECITIWERNFQLGLYSLVMYGMIIIYESYSSSSANGATTDHNHNPTAGDSYSAWSQWTWITFIVSLLGATGGLLVAATLKYADSILKTLAAAGAIVLSTVLGHYLLNGPLDMIVSIGALVSIIAIANYTLDKS